MGVVNTTYTFLGTDTITSTKLNNIIEETTFTGDAIQGTTLQVVSPGKLAVSAGGITSNELASNSVVSVKIANGAVITEKISDSAITTIKLANSTSSTTGVTTAKIADSNVTTAKLADASVVAGKLSGAQTGSAPIFGARAWVNFDADRDASGASNTSNTNRFIRASGNVSSVLKTGTGKFTVTMSTSLPNVNYAVVGTAGEDGAPRFLGSESSTQTTTQFFLTTDGQSGDVANFSNNSLVVFG